MPSSVIASWQYHPQQKTLTIRFVSGKLYRYLDVPQETIQGFTAAFAKGNYYNQFIRGRFMYEAVREQ